jgi:hypothetical protein
MSEQKRITFPGQSNGLDLTGRARLQAEQQRCIQMLNRAVPPVEAVGIVPAAPARGAMVITPGYEPLPGGTRRRDGIRMRELSPLAQMVANAWLKHQAREIDAPFIPPFDPAQVQVSEDYRALVERHEAGLVKCSSTEAGRGGGGGSGLAIDRYIEDGRWLSVLRDRIGQDVVMSVRRNMDRGNGRKPITASVLVDLVVLHGRDLSAVLSRHGWEGQTKHRRILRDALCAALDRMQGYRDG